ncbi:MAG: hypothetical protein O3C21_15945 [Verrucomicrobia bacterium]|nr:hypothetical protein [Verrucomicrobiota bacterium]
MFAPLAGMLAFPPYGLWWLMPGASWLLLLGLKQLSPRVSFCAGFISATLLFAATMSWLWNLFDVLAIVLWMILAGFTGIFCYFYRVAAVQFRNAAGTSLFAAVLWTGIEFFRSEVFVLKFPWITSGTAMPPGWLAPIIGTYGMTFLVILAAALLTHESCRWRGGTMIILLFATILTPRSISDPAGAPIRVVAVQNEGGAFKHHLDQSASAPGDVDLFIWPEHSVPYNLMEQDRQLGELQAFLKQRSAIAIVGTRRMDPTREAPDGNSAWFNMACAISADSILGYHDKNHPVHFFNDGIPGTQAKSVATPVGKVGMPVCFDVDFQDVVRRMTLDGAKFIAAPTMDSESWSAKQHLQHALLFRHRAAENGRWIVVASTSGVTQIIDTTGQSRSQLPLMRNGVLDSHLFSRSELTVFTRWGWMFGPACMWLAAVLVVIGLPVHWWLRRQQFAVSN